MLQPDTIQTLTDSAKTLISDSLAKTDSLVRMDSIAKADSLRTADSLKAIVRIPSGFEGTPHPSMANTEAWVFITIVALFFLLALSVSRSGSLIPETFRNFFQVKERSSIFSKATVNDFQIRFFIIIFSIEVISLYAYFLMCPPGIGFSFLKFVYFSGITLSFFGLKSLCFDLIGYIFLDRLSLKMAKESYFNVLALLGTLLFPLLITDIYTSYSVSHITGFIGLIMCCLAYILIIFKLFQIFLHKIVASFYILLYLCTLEFLPLFLLFQVYKILM